jgi:DNA helicase-2/ATP-dependent DNA helicase PcrA
MALKRRAREGKPPFALKYVLARTTSLDWSVLDLFYQMNGFKHFRNLFKLAEQQGDEGPLCNLSIISEYLARFMDKFSPVITASYLQDDKFQRQFFLCYIYALYRRQESEYEDEEVPFPKGRIPFLTIHQAKGLEFPVVVLGTPFKQLRGPTMIEKHMRKLLDGRGEPLDRIDRFDLMRMFYVAISRPKNLLVIPHFSGRGQQISEPFKTFLNEDKLTRISSYDMEKFPVATDNKGDIGKNYSYTGDFMLYKKCPRQYMIFKKYGFVPSRSQTMFIGSLIHKTIEDLHQLLIGIRS